MTLRAPHVVLEWPPEAPEAEEMRRLGVTWSVAPRQPVVPPKPPRRYKRRRDAKLSQRRVDAAWKLYESGWSLRRIANEVWERFGFASPGSARVALEQAFALDGRKLRDRLEATRVASTKHGRAPRRGRDHSGYKRWLREQRGEARPLCAGRRRNYPRRGEPCKQRAMVGSDYCCAHDPNRALALAAHTAKMRRRIGRANIELLEEAA